MTEERLISLIILRQSNELDAEGVRELNAWAERDLANRQLVDRISSEADLEREFNVWRAIDPQKGYELWQGYRRVRRRISVLRVIGLSAAACFLLFLSYQNLWHGGHHPTQPTVVKAANKSVLPGRNTATLTLANGRQILLDSAAEGAIVKEANVELVKKDGASIRYLTPSNESTAAVAYNILTTPKAGQFQLILPDGSKVWLNNVSRIRYPTVFAGKERTVELTGEAYFEITPRPDQPFHVKLRDADVEVLGTAFNVMAYEDEGGTQTTLVNGAVKVKSGAMAVQLKPDEQAQVIRGRELKLLKSVPSQDIISWKNGFFYFDKTTFTAVMRQLARWYDVEVVYEGSVPDIEFAGKIDRSLPLNDLLKFLDKNQIHFRLEERKLIVLP